MATLLKLLLLAGLLLLLWGLGTIVGFQSQNEFSSVSVIIVAVLGVASCLAAVFAFLSALTLYSPQNNSKASFRIGKYTAVWNPDRFHVLGYALMSYGMTIYVFSVTFLLISKYDGQAFNPTIESLGTAAYFSIVTIATVGYGDIHPLSRLARVAASAEILLGVAYTIFLFSVIAGFMRERGSEQTP